MSKVRKTKRELKLLLEEQTQGMHVVDVAIRKEPLLGWSAAFLVSDPVLADDYQQRFFEIETELRRKFELA